MKSFMSAAGGLALAATVVAGCGGTNLADKSPTLATKEAYFERGHREYLRLDFDRAEADLTQALALDSSYSEPLVDLGALAYDRGMQETDERSQIRRDELKKSRRYYARAEALGQQDASIYDRLCEIANALDDTGAFLKYAKLAASRYPYDRQYYNLGLAYYAAADWQNVIRTQKEAVEKFGESAYCGGFYRQIGRAYLKQDRDQTAEKQFAAGVLAVDACIVAVRSRGGKTAAIDVQRLQDDKIAMLLQLKRLHLTYKQKEKLDQVERQLREAGYPK
jgi:tetratricopeptide (TPR) repeat protein